MLPAYIIEELRRRERQRREDSARPRPQPEVEPAAPRPRPPVADEGDAERGVEILQIF